MKSEEGYPRECQINLEEHPLDQRPGVKCWAQGGGGKDEKSPKSPRVTLPRHRTRGPTSVSSTKLVLNNKFQGLNEQSQEGELFCLTSQTYHLALIWKISNFGAVPKKWMISVSLSQKTASMRMKHGLHVGFESSENIYELNSFIRNKIFKV
jgi:hypothetical protein